MDPPRLAVVGAGAIGGPVAAFLARRGVPVQVAVKHAAIRAAIERDGLVVEGVRGRHVARLAAVEAIEDLDGPVDAAFLAVKTFDTEDAARRLRPKLGPNGFVVTLQNGITLDAANAALGRERVLGCVVEWGSTMLGPGRIDVTSQGRFMLGEQDGKVTPRLRLAKEWLEATYPVDLVEDIRGALYSKVLVNSCITTTGAVTGQTLGTMLASRRARDVFLAIATEGLRVGQAAGVRFYALANGRMKPEMLGLDTPSGLARGFALWKRHALLRIVGVKYRRLRSSMLQSLERGRTTEIDEMNGLIAAWGRTHGVPTPVNDAMVRLVHEIEAGARRSEPRNLDEVPALASR